MSQQLPNRVALAEILGIPKICTLPTGDEPALPPRDGLVFGSQLMRIPPVRFVLSLIARSLLFRRSGSSRMGLGVLFTVVIDDGGRGVGGIGGVAARANDFVGRKARTHDWETEMEKEKQSF